MIDPAPVRYPTAMVCLAACAGLSLFVVVAAFAWGATGPVLFDEPVSSWLFVRNVHSTARHLAGPLTSQSSVNAQVAEGIGLALLALAITRDRWLALACLVVPPLIDGATIVAKLLINRTRGSDPGTAIEDFFPSGHTAGISSRMVMLVLLAWVVSNRPLVRWGAVTVALALSLAFAVSTTVAGTHYPTDAVGGLLFGASLAVLVTAATLRVGSSEHRRL